MTARYYLPPPLSPGARQIAGPEAHHLLHVMRAEAGARVVVFDGQGAEAEAVVVSRGRTEATLEIQDVRRVSREPPRRLHLGVALPKGDRQKWLVEKSVELGVASLTPLVSRRSVAQPSGKALERLRRTVIESSKQCGRNTLMEVAPSCELPAWLASAPPDARRWIASPAADALPPLGEASEIHATIGPEGGLTQEELALAAQHAWTAVSLGPRVLRVETAAIAIAAVVVSC